MKEHQESLAALRGEIDEINEQLLALIQQRGELVLEIARVKRAGGLEGPDPEREADILRRLTAHAGGPFGASAIRDIFKAILRASLDIQEEARHALMRVHAGDLVPAGGIRVGDVAIGAGVPVIMAGPCSIESREQMEEVAALVATLPGLRILRGGAYKPRTNPYTFQGLRDEGLQILQETAARHGLRTVTEVLDTSTLDVVAAHTDMLQVGARNMYNTELLKAIGRLRKPVLLKRGFMATIEELLLSAEYILTEGNENVVLCERGIRTFERATRNTLDISAVALLKKETSLPVIVDLSHALGRKDIMLPCARAALAAGADGLMFETHPRPERALSDGLQQLDPTEFRHMMAGLGLAAESVLSAATGTTVPPPGERP